MHFGLVTIPDKMNQMWYLPIGVSTYIFNLDWRGLVLMAVNLVISTLIWYPFFRVYDNQLVETEAAKARAKKEKQAAKVAAEKLQGATES